MRWPGSSSPSSAFPIIRWGRLPASFREHDFSRVGFRGCSYFVMFRPPSLLASQIVPTAASFLTGQPRLLHPSRTCVVAFARIGPTIRPTTGNWRSEDFHLARPAALSAAHERSRRSRLSSLARLSLLQLNAGIDLNNRCNHHSTKHRSYPFRAFGPRLYRVKAKRGPPAGLAAKVGSCGWLVLLQGRDLRMG